MTPFSDPFLHIPALILAVLLNPWLVVRHVAVRADAVRSGLLWGPLFVALNSAFLVGLDLGQIPISAGSLTALHGGFFIILAGGLALRRVSPLPTGSAELRLPGLLILAFAFLVLPFTHLAGIDTYKWQDSATLIRLEQSIPWLIHPLSLFGFTPRSCPSAQPMLLATIQILGGGSVDWGYYGVSILSGVVGILSAYALGRLLWPRKHTAVWFTALYVFSPVFVRYNHWATGRGLLLSLLPAFLWALLSFPRITAVAGAAAMSVLLALAHKTGWIAAAVLPLVFLAAQGLPRSGKRWVILPLALPWLILAYLMAPGASGLLSWPQAAAWGFTLGARFAVAAPLAALALFLRREWLLSARERAMFLGGLTTLPFACADEMYGAMLALPFAVYAAALGVEILTARGTAGRQQFVRVSLVILLAVGAVTTVWHRSRQAVRADVYAAARFLERYDPLGPFRLEAPGRTGSQIQAYCTGCPRFTVQGGGSPSRVRLRPPPRLSGNLRGDYRAWIAYLREAFQLEDAGTDWYGANPRVYYVTVDGQGSVPADTIAIFQTGRVQIYKLQSQPPPDAAE